MNLNLVLNLGVGLVLGKLKSDKKPTHRMSTNAAHRIALGLADIPCLKAAPGSSFPR